jgi:predicted acyl esterase
MTTEEIRRREADGVYSPESRPAVDVEAILLDLPLTGHLLLNEYTPWYREWLAHPTADPSRWPSSPCAGFEQISVPAFHVSGWYDIFLSAALENYQGMR